LENNNLSLTLAEAITSRRSVRGFKPDVIPQDILNKIFTVAQSAPSNCNTQPWTVYVASGEKRDELANKLTDIASKGTKPEPDFYYNDQFKGVYRQRQVDCAMALYDNMGVERSDRQARMKAMLRNFNFFEAPHAAFLCMPKGYDVGNGVDVGIYLQTLMLVMSSYGVASCSQGALGFYPQQVREVLNIDDNLGVVVGLSFGYEDGDNAANKTRTTREKLSEVVHFIS
jgi:nitroreductase